MSTFITYQSLNQELNQQGVGITASELQGFLTGLIAGSNQSEKRTTITQDFLNNGQPFSLSLRKHIEILYEEINKELHHADFNFTLLIHEEDLYVRIEDLVNWVNYFLLGLGIVQPKMDTLKGDIGEIIRDLIQITRLGYDKNEDPQELTFAFEEILEYVRMAAILCYNEFSITSKTPTLH